MTTYRRLLCLGSTMLLTVTAGGCIIVAGGSGWSWGPTIWTEVETEQFVLDTTGFETLEVRTHNGKIKFDGQSTPTSEVSITVTKKGGGLTSDGAREALDAIESFAESAGDGTLHIGWRWRGMKRASWSARVSFAVTGPGKLNLDVETHNGHIAVAGAAGNAKIVTHNGPVTVTSEGDRLHVESHNGEITAGYAGRDVTLVTHNGQIDADLRRCGPIRGDITTHNGSVEIAVGEETSAKIRCETHNGSIDLDAPIEAVKLCRRHVEGKLGDGGETLTVSTHNGSVVVKRPTG